MTAQPFRAQLNRRQRILDLVRQPACHFPPRRNLLRSHERADVVEDDHQLSRKEWSHYVKQSYDLVRAKLPKKVAKQYGLE